jgi:putative ABC transport system permease protein
VRLAEGVPADSAAVRLAEAFPRVEVASVAQLVERARERLSYFRQLALILGTVSLVVTGLLVGTIMAVSVSERYGTIAALRAVGVSRGHVVGALALESLLLCAVAGVVGLGLGMVTARYLETILADFPGLPRAVRFFVLRPADVVRGYGGVLAVGVLAALAPAWRAAGLEIATTLHREEP